MPTEAKTEQSHIHPRRRIRLSSIGNTLDGDGEFMSSTKRRLEEAELDRKQEDFKRELGVQQRIRELEIAAEAKRRFTASIQPRPSAKTPTLNFRSELKRAIFAQLIKNPKVTAFELCRAVDDIDCELELPRSLKKNGNNTLLVDAYREPERRARLHRQIDKVRSAMRKARMFA